MKKDRKDGNFVPFEQSFLVKILVLPLGFLYKAWTASIRFEISPKESLSKIKNIENPLVIMLWHNRLFLAGEWHRRFRKGKTCYGLISASRDGSWLETFYGWAGIKAIRGSSNRRGVQAMRELVKVVKQGHDVGITPDGSRGPKYKAKDGVVALSRITKSGVLLLSFQYSGFWALNSWDNFVIPYPFSKVSVHTRLISKEEMQNCDDQAEVTKLAESQLLKITYD